MQADCDPSRLGSVSGRAVALGRSLGPSGQAVHARAEAIPLVFAGLEEARAGTDDPVDAMQRVCTRLASLFAGHTDLADAAPTRTRTPVSRSVEEETGEHYGRLFERFRGDAFWGEPLRLLTTRLDRNGLDSRSFAGRSALDAGCGGARYTAAWSRLGVRAVGLDYSATGLASARRQASEVEPAFARFVRADVLHLPFADGAFDIVFSNGVLHHTRDWQHGVKELVRVLRPGGFGWLYVIERPGGLFWEAIEMLRDLLHGDDVDEVRACLVARGLPANRVFYMLDHVMAPINIRLTADEVAETLATAGATSIRRLERGTDADRSEYLHAHPERGHVLYGVGEQRFVFSRPQ